MSASIERLQMNYYTKNVSLAMNIKRKIIRLNCTSFHYVLLISNWNTPIALPVQPAYSCPKLRRVTLITADCPRYGFLEYCLLR